MGGAPRGGRVHAHRWRARHQFRRFDPAHRHEDPGAGRALATGSWSPRPMAAALSQFLVRGRPRRRARRSSARVRPDPAAVGGPFDDVEVPATDARRCPRYGGGDRRSANSTLPQCSPSPRSVGAMDRIFELTVDYAKARTAFGRPIGSFQAVKHLLADTSLAAGDEQGGLGGGDAGGRSARSDDATRGREHGQGVRERQRASSSRTTACRSSAASGTRGSTTCTSTSGGSRSTPRCTATRRGTASGSAACTDWGSTDVEANRGRSRRVPRPGPRVARRHTSSRSVTTRAKPRGVDHRTVEQMALERAMQRLLFDAGFAGITWPEEYGGRGLDAASTSSRSCEEAAGYRMPDLGVVGGTTFGVCANTMLAHASPEFLRRHVPKMLSGDELWCQFFSEPSAGSDLAGVHHPCRARRRPVDPQRREDLEQRRGLRRLRHVPGPHQLGRAEAPRPHVVRGEARRARRRRSSPSGRSTATRSSARSSSTTSSSPTTTSSARSTTAGAVTQTMLVYERGAGTAGSRRCGRLRRHQRGSHPTSSRSARRVGREHDPVVRQLIARAHINDVRARAARAADRRSTSRMDPAAARHRVVRQARGRDVPDPIRARIGMEIGGPAALCGTTRTSRQQTAVAQLPERPHHVDRRRHQRDAAQHHRRARPRPAARAELRHQQAVQGGAARRRRLEVVEPRPHDHAHRSVLPHQGVPAARRDRGADGRLSRSVGSRRCGCRRARDSTH